MTIIAAVLTGIAAGVLMKAFFKESNFVWDVVLGGVGGAVAFYLSTALSQTMYGYVSVLGTALLIAALGWLVVSRFGKTA
jgi:uncharacterized membrane protein YeaQ/YmgE (transglycosylase-associated protein family)